MTTEKLYSTKNDLSFAIREKSIALLNQQLADTSDLFSHTKQAHWNVKGVQFYQLHLLFDTLAEAVLDYVDLIAERAISLGGTAAGTTRMSAEASRLPEYPIDAVDGGEHIEALSERYAAVATSSRAAIDRAATLGDADTCDVFTEISRGLDKHLWVLEAHCQGKRNSL